MEYQIASLYLSTEDVPESSIIRIMKSPNLLVVEDIPEDILEMLVNRLCFNGYLRFTWTCKVFRTYAKEKPRYHRPWLMLPNKPGDKTRPFYSPLENRVYNMNLPKFARRSPCCGSYQGWLIFAHKSRGNFIYNPISKKRLGLPVHQVKKYEDDQHFKRSPFFLFKVVLSTVPSTTNTSSGNPGSDHPPLMAAAIANNRKILVTSCNGDDNKWHVFCPVTLKENLGLLYPNLGLWSLPQETKGDEEEEVELKFERNEEYTTDIISYKGEFYVVNNNGDLIIIKGVGSNEQKFSLRKVYMTPFKMKRKYHGLFNCTYLVESHNGELLKVLRIRKRKYDVGDEVAKLHKRMETSKFFVFRLELEESRWVEVESLCDQVLVLGHNCSQSISSGDLGLPRGDARRQNCIYFTDDCLDHYFSSCKRTYTDIGVYHLVDGSTDKFLPPELFGLNHLQRFRFPPIMFTPNPW